MQRNSQGAERGADGPSQPQDEGTSVKRTPAFPRSGYVWPYASGPYYGDVPESLRRSPGVVHTSVGTFQLGMSQQLIPHELKAGNRMPELGAQYFIVQVDTEAAGAGALAGLRQTIESAGGVVVVPDLPVTSMIARLDAAAYRAAQSAIGLVAIDHYHPAFKLDPTIGRIPLSDPVKALSEVYDLDVMLFPGETSQAVAEKLARMGGNVKAIFPEVIQVELHRSLLSQLAALEPVYRVTEHLPTQLLGEETTTTMQTGRWTLGAIPYHDAGIDGSGNGIAGTAPQVLMIIDTGISLDAGDLSDCRIDAGTAGPAHRKVALYASTASFGGMGDLLGCDAPQQGGFTHGHVVAASALGNATDIVASGGCGAYGTGFQAFDLQGNPWKLDGVAPGAKLVAYDANVTPQVVACSDPLVDAILPGTLYSTPSSGGLGNSYTTNNAKISNFSWGSESNTYSSNAIQVDTFLDEKGDAMVFIAAGNYGSDDDTNGLPDELTLGTPATTKNGIAMGASGNASDPGASPESRAAFSSMGPAVSATVNRVAPILMAPGQERGALGLASEFSCRSSDNDQTNPVQCDIITGLAGTSFASPAAAGAALLVRDYFAQGFYPTGGQINANRVQNISGALVKALLVASADFMTGANLTRGFRFNNEQGYGRIELDNVLPLENWPASPPGLIVADGGIGFCVGGATPGAVCTTNPQCGAGTCTGTNVNNTTLAGTINAVAATTQTTTFQVCNDQEELRVALVWLEGSASSALINDLDLEVISPAPVKTYVGNYYTDDNNKNRALDAGEDCPGHAGASGLLDEEQFSLPRCVNTPTDTRNLTESVVLSPDIDGDTTMDGNPADDNQIVPGTWTLNVKSKAGGSNANQRYAVVISGGVCLGSSVRFDKGTYTCNNKAKIVVNELDEGGGDPTIGQVGTRTTVHVLDPSSAVVDTETGIVFTKPNPAVLRFESAEVILSDSTARQPGNGVLDVRTGDRIRVTYADASPVANRLSFSDVECTVALTAGAITFADFGEDVQYAIGGGCEVNARGLREFGFPDRNIDATETLTYAFAFGSIENEDLDNVEASLRCVDIDCDSPALCLPSGAGCTPGAGGNCKANTDNTCSNNADSTCDPRRANNPTCDGGVAGSGTPLVTIVDSPKSLGFLPSGAAIGANFTIAGASDAVFNALPGGPTPKVEMLLEIKARISGKTASGMAISRHKLNVDDVTTLYSTDFPLGGVAVEVQERKLDNDEVEENPTTFVGNFMEDFRFETKTYADMTATGRNRSLGSPWHFDNGNGNFASGLGSITDESTITDTIAEFGEDKNFNGILDGTCRSAANVRCIVFPTDPVCTAATGGADPVCKHIEDRDNLNALFDSNWSTLGGCGWQTRAPGVCSGATARGCHINRDCLGRCQSGASPDGTPDSNRVCTVSGDCPTLGCSEIRSISCAVSADCAALNAGTCVALTETCIGNAGTCGGAGQTTGGVWHTGRIDSTTLAACMVNGSSAGQCQRTETISGTTGAKTWFEVLVTPVMEKVNQGVDAAGDPTHRVDITNWAWNQSIDLPDNNIAYTWEFDNDRAVLEPVDLVADGTLLGIGVGPFGPVSNGGNAALTNGYQVFAYMGACLNGDPCNNNLDCPAGQTPCGSSAASVNGNLGNNRVGKNGCFYEGVGTIPVSAREQLGQASPPDDDVDQDMDSLVDEFVKANGPVRNAVLDDWNGPDLRFSTLEDINGPSGKTFQAAVGIAHFEATATANLPTRGYGMAVDDMVVEWAEVQQVTDTTNCTTNGQCATVDLSTVNFFEGNSVVTITIQEKTPYGDPAAGPLVDCLATPGNAVCVNDCNDNNVLTDVGIDDKDCNNNGINDVIVKAQSETEPSGELVALDLVSPGLYKSTLPISAVYDSPGVLFIARQGTDAPTVTITYEDNEDGTGNKCRNDVDPNGQGQVQAATGVFFDTGIITVITGVLTEVGTNGVNHDGDGYADTGETLDMQLKLRNSSEVAIEGVVARLSSNDPKIECILQPFIVVGSLPGRTNVTSASAFRFKVSNTANRVGVNDNFAATFSVTMSSDSFDALAVPQSLTVDLDLDAAGGGTPTTFIEDFDGGGGTLGAFVNDNVDFGLASLAASDGYRCQYSNPDWVGSNSFGTSVAPTCFLGVNAAHADATWWHAEIAPALGTRGFTGTHSAHYGVDLAASQGFTTPMRTIDAIKTNNPVNLSSTLQSELSFKYQVSVVDNRVVNAGTGRSGDAAVVMVQLADSGGTGVGNWIKLSPYKNIYDTQKNDNYTNCHYDPIDDGTDEDDYFDPTDPDRRLGPSSTCFPEFNYVYQGDTQEPFGQGNIGRASEGPGLAGSGSGTWVEGLFDLSRFRGRRLRVRYLTSSYWGDADETMESRWAINQAGPAPEDDGWWVDNVQVSNTLTTPATITADSGVITPIACGNTCNTITPDLDTDPVSATLAAPGQVVELDAAGTPGSAADRCLSGALQYQFCISVDNDCQDAGDVLLRSFSDNPVVLDAPTITTHYAVDVRCSTATACLASAGVTVNVNCPGGSLGGQVIMCGTGSNSCGLAAKSGIQRPDVDTANEVSVNWLKGNFTTAATVGSYLSDGGIRGPVAASVNVLDATADGTPSGNCGNLGCTGTAGFYYIVKKVKAASTAETDIGYCNSSTWQEEFSRTAAVGSAAVLGTPIVHISSDDGRDAAFP